jgi:hypothetical protein
MANDQRGRARSLSLLGIFLALLAGHVGDARACSVCIPYPTRTAADLIIEGETVILARIDPERPFAFAPVDVLKGRVTGEPIDLLVDSATRQRLAVDPEIRAVIVQARPADPWVSLGIAGPDFEQLVRDVIRLGPAWPTQGPGPSERVAFFAPLLTHHDRKVAELAYLELGRAPYAEIRTWSGLVPRERIRTFLRNFAYLDWHAVYILMLGNVGSTEDQEFIAGSLEVASKLRSTRNLGALATALIEMRGADAVNLLEARYLRNRDRDPAEIVEVVKALSIHGNGGRRELREVIVGGYTALLETHPAQAGLVVSDLAAWQRWDLSALVRAIALSEESLDEPSLLLLRDYFGRSPLSKDAMALRRLNGRP